MRIGKGLLAAAALAALGACGAAGAPAPPGFVSPAVGADIADAGLRARVRACADLAAEMRLCRSVETGDASSLTPGSVFVYCTTRTGRAASFTCDAAGAIRPAGG